MSEIKIKIKSMSEIKIKSMSEIKIKKKNFKIISLTRIELPICCVN